MLLFQNINSGFNSSRILQYYVLREESGMLISNKFDRNKVSPFIIIIFVVVVDMNFNCFLNYMS